jgi:C4-dicarboxylate-specific signal transduction histidine kinase
MPQGGKLAIKTHKDKQTWDVVLTIEDTWVGIPNDVKDKLFTPIFTTKSKGQGFGLAVVKRMADALGGTVTFECEHGKGWKFMVRLLPRKKRNKG